MTEYDFSPEAMERYMSNQNRIAQWVGSSQQHSSADPFLLAPSEYGRSYIHEDPSYGRRFSHRRASRRDQGYHRTEQHPENHFPQQLVPQFPQGQGMSPSDQILMEPTEAYDSMPPHAPLPPLAHAFPQHPGSQQASISGGIPQLNPSNSEEIPPLQEHYDAPPSPPSLHMHRIPSHTSIQRSNSQPFPHAMARYSPPHIHLPTSSSGYAPRYHRREPSFTESYRSYSARSYSTDSFSSTSSRSYHSRSYTTVLPSSMTPTVIQPSRRHPIVVPINGGVGGYVVVPAVGQTLRVLDPARPYKDRSFIGRMFSPSTWGMRKKNYYRIRR